MISVQNGRQYMMAYAPYFKRITAYRLDNIVTVKNGEVADRFDELRDKLSKMRNICGESLQTVDQEIE